MKSCSAIPSVICNRSNRNASGPASLLPAPNAAPRRSTRPCPMDTPTGRPFPRPSNVTRASNQLPICTSENRASSSVPFPFKVTAPLACNPPPLISKVVICGTSPSMPITSKAPSSDGALRQPIAGKAIAIPRRSDIRLNAGGLPVARSTTRSPCPDPVTAPSGNAMLNVSKNLGDKSTVARIWLLPAFAPPNRLSQMASAATPSKLTGPAICMPPLSAVSRIRFARNSRPLMIVSLRKSRKSAAISYEIWSRGTPLTSGNRICPVTDALPCAIVTDWLALVINANGSRSSSDKAAVIVLFRTRLSSASPPGLRVSKTMNVVPASSARPPCWAVTNPRSSDIIN